MLLADAGADVLRVERARARPRRPTGPHWDLLNRSRPSVARRPQASRGRRPGARPGGAGRRPGRGVPARGGRTAGARARGVPGRNPGLVYGRMTGWGQDGPMAAAGRPRHRLHRPGRAPCWPIGRRGEPPVPPLNLVGDFGGGGMLLAFGVVAALVEAGRSGRGQVVDAAMVDGAASLMTMIYRLPPAGGWTRGPGRQHPRHGRPLLRGLRDGRRPVLRGRGHRGQVLRRAAAGWASTARTCPTRRTATHWPAMKARFAEVFATKTRDEWAAVFEGTDACAAPVLSPWRGRTSHPHNQARGTFVEVDGLVQPGPAPRFSRTPATVQPAAVAPGGRHRRGPGRLGGGPGRGGPAPVGRDVG